MERPIGANSPTGFEGRDPDPAFVAMQAEQAREVEQAMAELEPRLRHLVRARIEGLASFRELAEQLGYGSESSARRAFFEAQSKLALRLSNLRSAGQGPA